MPAWLSHGNMSSTMVKQIKHSEALYVSKKRADKKRDSPGALCRLAESHLRLQRYDSCRETTLEGLALYETGVVELDENMAAWLNFYKGKSCFHLGLLDESEDSFRLAA